MAISFNNSIANIVGTPGAITGVIADQPNASDVAEGTLYFSSDTIEIYQVVAGSWVNYTGGGGGGLTSVDNGLVLAPTLTNVQFGGLLIQDTALNCGNFNLDFNNIKVFTAASSNGTNIVLQDDIIYASIGSTQSGYFLNLANRTYLFGDYGNSVNGTCIVIDDVNEICKTRFNNFDSGISLNFASFNFKFGDFSGLNSFVWMEIDDSNEVITTYNTNGGSGIKLDFFNNKFLYGDFNNTANGTHIEINNANNIITTFNSGNQNGLKLEFSGGTFLFGSFQIFDNYYVRCDSSSGVSIGDELNQVNGTFIRVNDNTNQIVFNNTTGSYNFSNVPTFVSNAAALAGGLVVGDIYRVTGTGNMHIVF
jgi:hypothetical protein